MKIFTSITSFINKQLSSTFTIILFVLLGLSTNAQTTVNYAQRAANYNAGAVFVSGTAGIYDSGTSQLGMYANGGTTKQVVAWRTLKTAGDNTGSNRSLQVGDEFRISVSAHTAQGEMGFALLSSPTTRGSYANRLENAAVSLRLSGYGNWYATYSDGTTANAATSTGSTLIGGTTSYRNFIFTCILTAPNRMNIVINDATSSTTSFLYDVILNTSNPITEYSIFGDNLFNGSSFNDIFWNTSNSTDADYVKNTLTMPIGSSNGTFTIGGVLPNGLAANSTSTASVNALTKSGTGTLTLSAANTYTGASTVSGGTLQLGAAGNATNTPLGTTATGTSVTSGAVLDLNGFTLGTAEALTLNGTGISSGGALVNGSATAATYSGLITLGSASSIVSSSGNIVISNTGTLSGATFGLTLGGTATASSIASIIGTTSGTITKAGSGTWTLSGANTYTGSTSITAGTLRLSGSGTLGTGSAVRISSGATLDLNGVNATVSSLAETGGSNGGVVTLGSGTITINGANTGTLFQNSISGTGGVTMAGSGTTELVLYGTQSYSGTTSVSGGKLSTGVALSTSAVTISGGTFQLNAANVVPDATPVTLSGGTFSTGSAAGFSETVGTLAMSASSTIALGTGSHTLTFANSSAATWTTGTILTVTGWTGTNNGASSGTAGKIFFGSSNTGLTGLQLSRIRFNISSVLYGAAQLSTGEIVPTAGSVLYWGGTAAQTWTSSTWSSVEGGPFTAAWVAGSHCIFNVASSTITGIGTATAIAAITANENVTVTAGGTLGSGIVVPIFVENSKTLNFGTQNFTTTAGTGFIKNGPGTMSSANGNAYPGGFTMNAGTMVVGGINAMGNGGALNINGGTIGAIATRTITTRYTSINVGGDFTLGDAINNANISFADNIVLGSTTRTITLGSTGSYAFSGIISGTSTAGLTLAATAAGTLSLSGANTYPGATTINGGTLACGAATTLPSTTAVSLANTSGAILSLGTFNQTVASLAGGGTIGGTVSLGTGTLTVTGASSTTFSGSFSNTAGAVTLNNASAVLTLANATNAHTGVTTITAGDLRLNPVANATYASQIVLNGGKLSTTGITATRTWTSTSTLNLNATSTIDLGAASHTITFANSSAVSWAGTTLTINGWTGTASSSGTAGKIFFGATTGTLAAAQLAKITFTGYAGAAILLGTGELVPGLAVPILTTPTAVVTSSTAATLGATITSNGGASITERGTSYKTTSPVIATDNQLAEGGTTVSAFTHSRTPLAPQTQYFYAGYATNANGTGLSPEGNFRTWSNPPTVQPASFTTTSGNAQLVANWGAATFPVSGATQAGYAVIYATGTPTFTATNGAAPAAGVGTLVNVTTALSLSPNTTTTITGLTNGTLYNLLIVPYTWDGTNATTYNYLTTGALTTTGTPATTPTITTPTATVTASTAATLGATVTNNGGATLTARGTVYRTTTGVSATDNQLAEGGTAVSAFTHSRSPLAPETQYFYKGYATNSAGTSLSTEGNFRTWSNPATVQPASFSTTSGSSSLVANWTTATFPASGATQAGYVVIYSTGTPTLSSANGVVPAAGVGTLVNITPTNLPTTPALTTTISGLTNGTLYNLLIVPYTWDGVNATTYNYFTTGAKTTTGTPAAVTYTWNGGTSGAWATATNWTPNGVPSTGDAVIFNTGGNMAISSVPDVSLTSMVVSTSGSNVTLTPLSGVASRTITLSNASTALNIATGTTLNITGTLTTPTTLGIVFTGAGNTATIAGTLNLNNGGTGATGFYTATNSTTTVSGIFSRASNCTVTSTATNFIIATTGTFQMKGGAASAPTAAWNTGSTLEMNQTFTAASTTITNLAQSFSNVTINANMTSPGGLDFAGTMTTIGGNFTVTTTGTGSVIFNSSTTTITATVGGNFNQSAGTFIGVNSSGNLTLNVTGSGTSTISGGTFNFDSSASAISPTLSFTNNFTQSGGTINLSTAYTGAGTHTSNFTVGGNFSQTAGTFEYATASLTSTTASYRLNVAGTFSRSGTTTAMQATGGSANGLVIMNGGASQSISVTSTTATTTFIQYTINSGSTTALLSNLPSSNVTISGGGTLNCSTFIIQDANNASVFINSGTLGIGSSNGITSGTTLSGNVQGTGTRTFNVGANYVYNGTVNQVTGTGLPTALTGVLTIANTGTSPNNVVSLTQNSSTSGTVNLNSGSLDLNGLTLTLSSNAAQSIAGSGSNTFNIVGAAGSTLALSAPTTSHVVTLSNFGTGTSANLTTGANVNVQLNSNTQLDCAGNGTSTSMLTVLGKLTMNSGTASNIANVHPPFYGTGSTLVYAVTYGRFNEWNATSGPGYPFNVTASAGTLSVVNIVNTYKKAAGTLTVASGAIFSVADLTTGNGSGIGVEFLGDIINDGTISLNAGSNTTSQRLKGANLTNGSTNTTATVNLSATIGGDLELTGNYLDNANFNANARAVFFTGTGTQTISGTATAPFNIDYIVSIKTAGIVQLGVDCLTGAPNGGNGITLSSATDIFDLNGKTFTLGTAAQTCTISGNGFFRSSSAASIIINGTGDATGTLKFETGNQTIGGLTINRTATGLVTLGTPLTVATTLAVVSTSTLNNGGNTLTVSASGNNSVAGIIAGAGALVKTGAGTLTLTAVSGNNTTNAYSGGTTINTGGSGTINVTGLTNISSTAITSATQAVTFSPTTPTNGTYQLLPGALTVSTQSFSHNAGPTKGVTFNYANSTITVGAATVTTTAISPTTYCAGASFSVAFTTNANLSGTYTAQLSDAFGSFSSPVAIGTNTVSPITVTIPLGTVGGTGYRIRIVNLGTPITGSDNGTNITVNPASTAAVISGSASICTGSSTNLQVAITGGISPFTVVYTTGSVSSYTSGSNISVSPTSTTTYTITSVTDANGCLGGGNSGSAVVTLTTTTTTNGGTSWSNGTPTTTTAAVFDGSTGTISSDFAACSLVLTNSAIVTVSSGVDVTLSLNGAITVNTGSTFTLNNNANLIQSGTTNTNSGNIIVNRNSSALMRFDYTLWSSPVTGSQTLLNFSPLTNTSRFYTYKTIGAGAPADPPNIYVAVASPSTTTFATAKGYLIRMPFDHPTSATIWNGSFTGVPNNGDIPYTMDNGIAGQRFNLVGNPYPSPISMTQFVTDNSSNITGTLYFWRETNGTTANNAYCSWAGGTFTTNNEAQVVNPSGIIRTGQGFFVEVKPSNPSNVLNFKNGQRSSDNADQFFRNNSLAHSPTSIETNRFWLNLTNAAGAFSQMAAGYMTDATDGVDIYDGKNINTGSVLLNSILNNEDYTIQGKSLPFNTADVLPLSYKVTNAGDHTITLDHVDGLFTDVSQPIYLKDNLTTTVHDLNTGAYTFASDAGTFNDRFEIIFALPLGIGNPTFTANNVVIYSQNHDFVVNSGKIIMASIKVFDIRGRLLQEKKGINASQTTISGGLANEVLLVQITSDEGIVVTKKVIR